MALWEYQSWGIPFTYRFQLSFLDMIWKLCNKIQSFLEVEHRQISIFKLEQLTVNKFEIQTKSSNTFLETNLSSSDSHYFKYFWMLKMSNYIPIDFSVHLYVDRKSWIKRTVDDLGESLENVLRKDTLRQTLFEY